MGSRRAAALLPAALLLSAFRVCANEPRTIQIQVEGTPRFDVFYYRARNNNTGALFGGLIGAGIQSGIESDNDAEKRRTLSPHVSERIWEEAFVKTLNETLQAKGFEPAWVEAKGKDVHAKADAYLTLFPDSYGFRMVDSTTTTLSAYVEFDAIYALQPLKRNGGKPPRELFYVTGERQTSYEQWLTEAPALNGEIESVLARAARRLANKIVYNIK